MYHAYWIENGTKEEMRASAKTLEELNTMIYGRPYSPMHKSLMIWKDSDERGNAPSLP